MDMKPSICIICRQPKDQFNEEHVFPASIGGRFIIKTVCTDCNSLLGKHIDGPFSNHKAILVHRLLNNIKRGVRKIKNPFGRQVHSDGREFIVNFGPKGFEGHFTPTMQILDTEEGPVAQLTIPKSMMTSPVETVEKYIRKFEKMVGVRVASYTIEKHNDPTVLIAKAVDSSNKMIWEFLKIGYESAVTCIPVYYKDDMAIKYSQMLYSHQLDRNFLDRINPSGEVTADLLNHLRNIRNLNHFSSSVSLFQHPDHGLACVIKMFDLPDYCFILSPDKSLLDDRIILLLNNAITKQFQCVLVKRAKDFTFSFNRELFAAEHYRELKKSKAYRDTMFQYEMKQIPLFDGNGSQILPNVEMLSCVPLQVADFALLSRYDSIAIPIPPGNFLKSNKTNLLYPLLNIRYNF